MALESDALRVIAFDKKAIKMDLLRLWSENLKGQTTNYSQHPSGASAVIAGFLDEEFCQITLHPGRVEILAGKRDVETNANPRPFSDFGPSLTIAKRIFSEVAIKMDVHRVAIVMELFEKQPTTSDALDRIRRELPFLDLRSDDDDISFQVTRRVRSAALPSITINRLCRWGTAVQQMLQFEVQASSGENSHGVAKVINSQSVFTAFYDINCIPREEPLTHADACDLLTELGEKMSALVEGGYAALI